MIVKWIYLYYNVCFGRSIHETLFFSTTVVMKISKCYLNGGNTCILCAIVTTHNCRTTYNNGIKLKSKGMYRYMLTANQLYLATILGSLFVGANFNQSIRLE